MSDEINHGGPAFPLTAGQQVYVTGMTLRDWFAGQALSAVMDLCRGDTLTPGQHRSQLFAASAYRIADAMIAARETGGAA